MGKGSLQVGALCWRQTDAGPQVLLITSRTTRRWIIPKGWPEEGADLHEQAAQEAWEEGGVRGEVSAQSLGHYSYDKLKKSGETKRIRVEVYPLNVLVEAGDWPEKAERERRWLPLTEAADAADEPELAQLLRTWTPAP
jgi:8-oxo-dGTP pyrophosphatase MutT (NUDIX family)